MKKLFFALVMLMVFALPFASASIFSDAVRLARIRLGDWGLISGGSMDSYVYVYNDNSDEKVRGGQVSITIMDEGIYDSSGDIRLSPKEGKGQSFITELDDLPEGEYLVRVRFTAENGVKKTRYRYVYVE